MFYRNTDKNRNEKLSQSEKNIRKRLNIRLLSQTRIIHGKTLAPTLANYSSINFQGFQNYINRVSRGKKSFEIVGIDVGIGTLKNLRILSLGRNLIKGFAGLEALGDTLEELWISYNLIEKMKGINAMRNLRVVYMSNNLVREWTEFNKLQELTNLQDLVFVGNPLYESLEVGLFVSSSSLA